MEKFGISQVYWRSIFRRLYEQLSDFFSTMDIRHILLVAFALHLLAAAFPNDGGLVFDEKHYVPAARLTLQGLGANPEHTPYTKVLIAISIAVFGDHWFAWRFPIIVSSTLSLYAFYLLANKFMEKKYALYASAFLAFDIVYFIHGTIAVIDFPSILFGLLFMNFYFERKYKWAALCAAISFLFLEKVLFFMVAIGLYHLVTNMRKKKNMGSIERKPERTESSKSIRKIFLNRLGKKQSWIKLFSFIMIFSIVVVSGIAVYDAVWHPPRKNIETVKTKKTIYQGENGTIYSTATTRWTETRHEYINNPIEHLSYAYNYLIGKPVNVTSKPSEWQEPWSWVLPIHPFRHAGYLVVTVRTGDIVFYKINWRAQGTIPIWYSIWLILPMAIWNIVKKRQTKFDVLFLAWIIVSYLPWIIWGIKDIQRFPFNYMFLYTIPALCLGIPYFWSRLRIRESMRKIGLFTHLVLTIIFFMYYFPVGLIFK